MLFRLKFCTRRSDSSVATEAELEEAELEEEVEAVEFEPFVCRKCGKLVTSPFFEVCEGK
jgi:hypothetical protein